MTSVYMYDDVTAALIPADAEYVAYYTDGRYANLAACKARCTKAKFVGIAVKSSDPAEALDVEPGDATIADVFYWLKGKAKKDGPFIAPMIYIQASDADELMMHMDANHFVQKRDFLLWTAHYTGKAHLCGPSTCKECHAEADATQFTNRANGKSLDESVVASWALRSSSAAPASVPDSDWPANLTLKRGSTGNAVKVLQQHLHDSGKYGARGLEPVDGAFGPGTEAAVRNYQKDVGLAVDGVAGPKTRAKLGVK